MFSKKILSRPVVCKLSDLQNYYCHKNFVFSLLQDGLLRMRSCEQALHNQIHYEKEMQHHVKSSGMTADIEHTTSGSNKKNVKFITNTKSQEAATQDQISLLLPECAKLEIR